MKTPAKYRAQGRRSVKVTIPRFMDYFYQFSKKEQSIIAREISLLTLPGQWKELDKSLSDLKMTETEIMKQVKAVRNGRKEAKARI